MPNRASFVAFLMEQLSPLGEITTRRLFGGNSLYCEGIVFALVANDTLYLKADDINRIDFESAGLPQFHPFGDTRMSMGYYQAPSELFEDADAMYHWAGSAVAAGRRASIKKSRQKKKRS